MRGFSGHFPPSQLLYLWDLVLAYDSMEVRLRIKKNCKSQVQLYPNKNSEIRLTMRLFLVNPQNVRQAEAEEFNNTST